MLRRFVFWTACSLITAGLVGCGGSKVKLKTVAAGGTVTHNGQAVEGASVTFYPADAMSGKAAGGTTDASGKFTLQTLVGGSTMSPGELVGDYNVTITKVNAAAIAPAAAPNVNKPIGGDPAAGGKAPTGESTAVPTAEQLLPKKYSEPGTTPLKGINVPAAGKSDFAFDLTDG